MFIRKCETVRSCRTALEWSVGSTMGGTAPGTNDGAESCTKGPRSEAGNVAGSVGETVALLLHQVEAVPRTVHDPHAGRGAGRNLRRRDGAFMTLVRPDEVQVAPFEGHAH